MNEINEQLKGISELVTRIDAKILDINTKLEELIKALHEYDGNDEYGESSFEAFMDDEEAANKRMDIIGQNGNEGSHYVTNEEADDDAFNDYGERKVVGKDKDKSNNPDKHTGDKRKVVGKEMVLGEWQTKNKNKQYYKNKRSKRNVDKKSAVVEHQKHPPHKH
jgi:hypothetical protein